MKKSTIIPASLILLGLVAAAWLLGVPPGGEDAARHAEARLVDGVARFDAKEYEAAIETLEQVPAGTPQEAEARYYEGSAYMMLKDYESAAARLEDSLALQPSDTGILYALGVVYYKLGNLKLAKGYFAAVLEINPDDEHAKGLMDIMAKLERQSGPGAATEEAAGD
jgi:tetratricopeptide (TPR) repeat protein